MLEEAANITGLHARRHEAELKLRAAETNLARAEDLRAQLESQLGNLKRQARQASRYRNISGAIRSAEAELLALQRARVDVAPRSGRAKRCMRRKWPWRQRQTPPQPRPPAPRRPPPSCPHCAKPKPTPHRPGTPPRVAGTDRRRGTPRPAALAEAQRRIAQLRQDLTHAATVAARRGGGGSASGGGGNHAGRGRQAVMTSRTAAAEAASIAAAEAVRVAETRGQPRHRGRRRGQRPCPGGDPASGAGGAPRRTGSTSSSKPSPTNANGSPRSRSIRQRSAGRRRMRPTPKPPWPPPGRRSNRRNTPAPQPRQRWQSARGRQAEADSARARLAAEVQALAEILAVKDGERWPPMIDRLTVADGLEAALGAALGEELTSALNPERGAALAGFATVRPGPGAAGRRHAVGGFRAGSAGAGPGVVADWPGRERRRRLAHQCQPGAGAVAGLPRRARSGAGTAIPFVPARRHRPRCGCSSATGWPVCARRAAAARSQEARGRAPPGRRAEAEAPQARGNRRTAARTAGGTRAEARTRPRQPRRPAQPGRLADRPAGRGGRPAGAHRPANGRGAWPLSPQCGKPTPRLPDIAALRATVEQARAALSAARSRGSRGADAARHRWRATTPPASNRRRVIVAERAGWAERASDAADRVTDLAARQTEAEARAAALEAQPARDRRPTRASTGRADRRRSRPPPRRAKPCPWPRRRHRRPIAPPAPPRAALASAPRRRGARRGRHAAGQPCLGHRRRTHPGTAGRKPRAARSARRPKPGERGQSPPPPGTPAQGARGDGAGQPARRTGGRRRRKADRHDRNASATN